MIRLIHTRSKIPFPDPYVLQIEYPGYPNPDSDTEYSKLTRSTYRKMQGSWGYTELLERRQDVSQLQVVLQVLSGTQAESVKHRENASHLPLFFTIFRLPVMIAMC